MQTRPPRLPAKTHASVGNRRVREKNTSLLNKNTPHDTHSHTRALNIALEVELIYAAVLSQLRLCMAASQYLY